jgi:hypothetical protein
MSEKIPVEEFQNEVPAFNETHAEETVSKAEIIAEWARIRQLNFYEIFRISFFSSPQQITEAYKSRRARFQSPYYAERSYDEVQEHLRAILQKIDAAFQTLMDEQKRLDYNQEIRGHKKAKTPTSSPESPELPHSSTEMNGAFQAQGGINMPNPPGRPEEIFFQEPGAEPNQDPFAPSSQPEGLIDQDNTATPNSSWETGVQSGSTLEPVETRWRYPGLIVTGQLIIIAALLKIIFFLLFHYLL